MTKKRDNDTRIYIDEEGYKQTLQEIQNLTKQLNLVNRGRGLVHKFGEGENWDSAEFLEIERLTQMLSREIYEKRLFLENVIILPKLGKTDIVDFGDILKLNMIFSEDDKDEMIIKLVGFAKRDSGKDYVEVSVNSPLGSAIYGKKFGDRISYDVGNVTYQVEILEKLNLEEKENTSIKPRIK